MERAQYLNIKYYVDFNAWILPRFSAHYWHMLCVYNA